MRAAAATSCLASLSLLAQAAAQFQVYPASGNLKIPDQSPVGRGVAIANLIPFDLDFTALPDHTSDDAYKKASNNAWEASVSLYDNGNSFGSMPALTWEVGKGPGRANTTLANPWNACVLILPQLNDLLPINQSGNSSCFDIIDKECLYTILGQASANFQSILSRAPSLTPDIVAAACRAAATVPLIDKCFKTQNSSQPNHIQAYHVFNPSNSQPLVLGIDKYDSASRHIVQPAVSGRTWPMVIVEAQGNTTIQAVAACPYAYHRGNPPADKHPSPDGTCGGLVRYSCLNTKFFYGRCCGKDGYCGYSGQECAIGCQADYGLCDTVVTVTETDSHRTTVTVLPSSTPASAATTTSTPTTTSSVISGSSPTPMPTCYFNDGFFAGTLDHWDQYGGSYTALHGSMIGPASLGDKALVKGLDATDTRITTYVTLSGTLRGNAGVVFRVTNPSVGSDAYNGYYAGISGSGFVILGRVNQAYTQLGRAPISVASDGKYYLQVDAIGSRISVTVGNVGFPQIVVHDSTWTHGATGVRVYQIDTKFAEFQVCPTAGDDFEQANYGNWTTYGPSFDASSRSLVVGKAPEARAVLKTLQIGDATNHAHMEYEADITLGADGDDDSDAGLLISVASAGPGPNAYDGYYVGIGRSNVIVAGRAQHNWTELSRQTRPVSVGVAHKLTLTLIEPFLTASLDGRRDDDQSFNVGGIMLYGQVGIQVRKTSATFDNVTIAIV